MKLSLRNVFKYVVVISLFAACTSSKNGVKSHQNPLLSAEEHSLLLQKVTNYAEIMVIYGRDRYGEVHSPLFAQSLTRDAVPTLIFDWNRDGYIDIDAGEFPAYEYPNGVFHRFTNIPLGYEYSPRTGRRFQSMTDWDGVEYVFDDDQGAHKQFVTGMDITRNAGLLTVLFALSDITDDSRYALAADSAITFWFDNTQNTVSGLFPWGEHLAWDFVIDGPVHSAGPTKGFYRYDAAEWDEGSRFEFWEYLVNRPQQVGFEHTPLEKFALGLWQSHFWDKENMYYDRHANYYTGEYTYGERGSFPRLYRHFMHVWSLAALNTTNEAFLDTIKTVMRRSVDGQRHAIRKNIAENGPDYNHPPFSYIDPEYDIKQHLTQSLGFALAAYRLRDFDSELSDYLFTYANEQFDEHIRQRGGDPAIIVGSWDYIKVYKLTGRDEFLQMARNGADYAADNKAWQRNAKYNAENARWLIRAYAYFDDIRYLQAAEWYINQMIENYLDGNSPLPKFVEFPYIRNWDGSPFQTWYSAHHGSDDVMESILFFLFPEKSLNQVYRFREI